MSQKESLYQVSQREGSVVVWSACGGTRWCVGKHVELLGFWAWPRAKAFAVKHGAVFLDTTHGRVVTPS